MVIIQAVTFLCLDFLVVVEAAETCSGWAERLKRTCGGRWAGSLQNDVRHDNADDWSFDIASSPPNSSTVDGNDRGDRPASYVGGASLKFVSVITSEEVGSAVRLARFLLSVGYSKCDFHFACVDPRCQVLLAKHGLAPSLSSAALAPDASERPQQSGARARSNEADGDSSEALLKVRCSEISAGGEAPSGGSSRTAGKARARHAHHQPPSAPSAARRPSPPKRPPEPPPAATKPAGGALRPAVAKPLTAVTPLSAPWRASGESQKGFAGQKKRAWNARAAGSRRTLLLVSQSRALANSTARHLPPATASFSPSGNSGPRIPAPNTPSPDNHDDGWRRSAQEARLRRCVTVGERLQVVGSLLRQGYAVCFLDAPRLFLFQDPLVHVCPPRQRREEVLLAVRDFSFFVARPDPRTVKVFESMRREFLAGLHAPDQHLFHRAVTRFLTTVADPSKVRTRGDVSGQVVAAVEPTEGAAGGGEGGGSKGGGKGGGGTGHSLVHLLDPSRFVRATEHRNEEDVGGAGTHALRDFLSKRRGGRKGERGRSKGALAEKLLLAGSQEGESSTSSLVVGTWAPSARSPAAPMPQHPEFLLYKPTTTWPAQENKIKGKEREKAAKRGDRGKRPGDNDEMGGSVVVASAVAVLFVRPSQEQQPSTTALLEGAVSAAAAAAAAGAGARAHRDDAAVAATAVASTRTASLWRKLVMVHVSCVEGGEVGRLFAARHLFGFAADNQDTGYYTTKRRRTITLLDQTFASLQDLKLASVALAAAARATGRAIRAFPPLAPNSGSGSPHWNVLSPAKLDAWAGVELVEHDYFQRAAEFEQAKHMYSPRAQQAGSAGSGTSPPLRLTVREAYSSWSNQDPRGSVAAAVAAAKEADREPAKSAGEGDGDSDDDDGAAAASGLLTAAASASSTARRRVGKRGARVDEVVLVLRFSATSSSSSSSSSSFSSSSSRSTSSSSSGGGTNTGGRQGDDQEPPPEFGRGAEWASRHGWEVGGGGPEAVQRLRLAELLGFRPFTCALLAWPPSSSSSPPTSSASSPSSAVVDSQLGQRAHRGKLQTTQRCLHKCDGPSEVVVASGGFPGLAT